MIKNNDLAIIIPAYKSDFLDAALGSIVNQTCKNFTVYIGDDCSPYDLYSIIKPYEQIIKIIYKRFDTNMGGQDLVGQWNRCMEMIRDEQWIWLFSDDDIMGKDCVRLFYNQIEVNSDYDVYHFDVKVIDEFGKVTFVPHVYPDVIQSYDYYKGKMQGQFLSLVVENIFSRKVWEKTGGFENFDLAWGSDTASWIKFMQNSGMKTVYGDNVFWRCSTKNISPNVSESIVIRKIAALNSYYRWSCQFFSNKGISLRILNLRTYFRRIKYFKTFVSRKIVIESNRQFCCNHNLQLIEPILNYLTR